MSMGIAHRVLLIMLNVFWGISACLCRHNSIVCCKVGVALETLRL